MSYNWKGMLKNRNYVVRFPVCTIPLYIIFPGIAVLPGIINIKRNNHYFFYFSECTYVNKRCWSYCCQTRFQYIFQKLLLVISTEHAFYEAFRNDVINATECRGIWSAEILKSKDGKLFFGIKWKKKKRNCLVQHIYYLSIHGHVHYLWYKKLLMCRCFQDTRVATLPEVSYTKHFDLSWVVFGSGIAFWLMRLVRANMTS